MDTSEVRIGNYLQNIEGKLETITYITASEIGVVFGEYPADFLYGVALTPEIIKQLGFSNTEDKNHVGIAVDNDFFILSIPRRQDVITEKYYSWHYECNYLHKKI